MDDETVETGELKMEKIDRYTLNDFIVQDRLYE